MFDSQTTWQQDAAVELAEEGAVLYIQTWYSDHIFRPRCTEPRPVRLLQDPTQWLHAIVEVWTDVIDLSVAVHMYLVRPSPEASALRTQQICHVLLVQHPIPDCSSIMITHLNSAEPERGVVPQIAVTRNEVTKDSLILLAELERLCLPATSDLQCIVWFGEIEIQPQDVLVARHGYNYFIVINSIFGPLPTDPNPWDDFDDLDLLQTKAKVGRQTAGSVAHGQRPTICLDDCIPPHPTIHVDMASVFRLQSHLAAIPIEPLSDWPADFDIPEVTQSALQELCGSPDHPPAAFHFYVDGSCHQGSHVGAGIVALVETSEGRYFGGCLSKKITAADRSYLGEHGAMIWALIWALQCSEWITTHLPDATVDFHFHFDALATGYQSAGWWNAWSHQNWRVLMRSLAHVLQTKHGFQHLHWSHVRAHTGEPWNELADCLAKHAAVHPELVEDSLVWTSWLDDSDLMHAIQWIWFLYATSNQASAYPPMTGHLLQHRLCVPRNASEPENPIDSPACVPSAKRVITLDFKCASMNVLTLGQNVGNGHSSVTRQRLLQQQLSDCGLHVVGLQETRHKYLLDKSNAHFHMIGHPADSNGCEGVQIWITKTLPLFADGPLLQAKHITIVDSQPNWLIVKLHTAEWQCVFVNAHAPHSGHDPTTVSAFWSILSSKIRALERTWPIFFLGDANAHLGDKISTAVGCLHSTKENVSGQHFHNWLLEHGLWLPATFATTHPSDVHDTYVSPDGAHTARLDYIAIPQALAFDHVHSFVQENVDISLVRLDHMPVCCHLRFTISKRQGPQLQSRIPTYDDRFVTHCLQDSDVFCSFHEQIPLPSWALDPHSTAHWLETHAQQAAAQIAPVVTRVRRKWHISAATWELVDQKKHLFKQIRSMHRSLKFTLAQAIFHGWKASVQPSQPSVLPDLIPTLPSWLRLHDQAYALALRDHHQLALRVTSAIKQEDARYYESLAHEAGQVFTTEGLTGLWSKLKAVLPKNRCRHSQQRYDIAAGLQEHFAALEAGTALPIHALRTACCHRNRQDIDARPSLAFVDLTELPTLAEVEAICLRQKAHKAPGPDGIGSNLCRQAAAALAPQIHNLLMKALLSGIEPFQYKGGLMRAIWKRKGSPSDPSTYRGILLANTFGKVCHAWARKRLLSTMLQRKAVGQLGGLPSRQTATGIHIIRLHAQLGRIQALSTAVIFVDIKSAFHHLLREFIFSVRNPMTKQELLKVFDARERDVSALAHALQLAIDEEVRDIPYALRLFLHDMHQDTWFVDEPANPLVTATRRGTRPGSPIADIGYNLLMARIMHQLQFALDDHPVYRQGYAAMNAFTPPVAWVDDLAIPLVTTHPSDLLPLVSDVAATMHAIFHAHGLELNLDGGKTEAVVMFRGPGANPQRTQTFDIDRPPVLTVSNDTHVFQLRIVPSYRHLGARFAMDADLHAEVDARLGMLRQAFEEQKKAVFLNRHIAVEGRQTLYASLVLSRLLYGTSVWSRISNSQLQRIESAILMHQRRIANIGFWSDTNMTDQDFRHKHQLMPFRVMLARNRLVYLQHIARHGEPFYQRMLLLEWSSSHGWLHEVCSDLQWMSRLVSLPFDVPAHAADWPELWSCLAIDASWKAKVARACRKHSLEEKIAWEVSYYHDHIQRELHDFGVTLLVPKPDDPSEDAAFACSCCPARFASYQQLALHSAKLHGYVTPERRYIQSTICPGCLTDFHTTSRVLQHLRYRPNGCWDRIEHARVPDEPIHIGLPKHLKQVKRLPAVRRHSGPIRPTSIQRARIQLRIQIAQLRSEGQDDFVWWHPSPDDPDVVRAFDSFDFGLREWFNQPDPTEGTFHDIMYACMLESECSDMKMGRLFVHWIETRFHQVWPSDLDPDVAAILEQAHMSLLDTLPTWTMRLRMKELTQRWLHLPSDYPDFPKPVPAAQPRTPGYQHPISSAFAHMQSLEEVRKRWRIESCPRQLTHQGRGPFYVVHLYSGRRREGDFHFWAQQYLRQCQRPDVLILSVDTAIDDSLNVHSPRVWTFLMRIAREGRIAALLLGPPCETWSGARFVELYDLFGVRLRGPRPLRMADCLWGLSDLTCSELCQVSVGNGLLLKGLWLSCAVALRRGAVVLEHPALPQEDFKPSIWKLALILMLLRRPGHLFNKITIGQWQYGAVSTKPTTLLYANFDLPLALRRGVIDGISRPQVQLIGRSATGEFNTSKAKEYPAALNQALTDGLLAGLSQFPVPSQHADDLEGHEFAQKAASAEHGIIRPDYQPL
eukprot:s283_g8.t1